MVLESLKEAFKKPLTYIGIVAIPLIVCLFGFLYVITFSDPYGRMQDMPVAVVNLDRGATVNGEEVNYGGDIAESILENDAVKWTLETSDLATEEAVRNSDYYLALVIPEDFSQRVAAGKVSEPEQAGLTFYRNVRKNFMLATLSKNIESQLQQIANAQVSKEYARALAEGLISAGDGLSEAADGAGELKDGLADAADGAARLNDGAATLANGAATLAESTSGGSSLATGANSLNSGLADASQGAATLSGSSAALASGASALVGSLADSLGSAEAEGTLINGAASIAAGSASLAAGLEDAGAGLATLQEGSDTLAENLGTLNAAAVALGDSYSHLTDEQRLAYISQIAAGAQAAQAGAQDLSNGVSQVAGSAEEGTGIAYAAANAQKLGQGASMLQSSLETMRANLDGEGSVGLRLVSGAEQLAGGAAALSSGVSSASEGSAALAEGVGSVGSAAQRLSDGASTLGDGAASLAQGLGTAKDGGGALASSLADGASEVKEGLTTDADGYADYVGGPVEVTDAAIGDLDSFGYGFAPMFLTICLWLASLLMFFIFDPFPDYAQMDAGRFKVVLGRWPLYLCMVAAVVLAVCAVAFAVGLQMTSAALFVAVVACVAVCFALILQAFSLFDIPGKALAIMVLIVQIVCCSGTLPTFLGSDFSMAVSGWLPFTYAIDAYREVLSGGSAAVVAADLGTVAMFAACALALSLLLFPLARKAKLNRDRKALADMSASPLLTA